MNSDAAFFSDVDTATLGDASTALGLNLIMEGPRPNAPENYPRFAGPAATMVFAPVRDPGAKALFSSTTWWKAFPQARWSSSTQQVLLWPSGAGARAASANGAAPSAA